MAFRYLFAFLLALCLSHPPHSVLVAQNLPYKAVNLGNWLLAEGWMKPSLFDGNANKGWNSSAANATKFQKYLAAENGGGADLVANCTSASASGWETFKFEWAWQHPVESLAVRKAATNFKSLSGVANKIKLAYTMLTLPSWQRNIDLGKANHNLKSVLATTNMKKRKNGGFRSMWRREKKTETQVAHVIRTKSVQFMPFNLSFFLTLSAVMWFAYGLFLSDICIAISTPTLSLPNVLDFALGVLQMLLYAIYRNATIYHIKKLTIWDTALTLSMGSGSNKDSSTTSCDNNSIIEAPPSNGRTLDTFGQRTSIYRGIDIDGPEDIKLIFGIIAVEGKDNQEKVAK
ncbi:hypothetical protein S245_044913, partial [Arachis hypogaea]